MKQILYKGMLLMVLILVIFILPTEKIVRNLVIYITHSNYLRNTQWLKLQRITDWVFHLK